MRRQEPLCAGACRHRRPDQSSLQLESRQQGACGSQLAPEVPQHVPLGRGVKVSQLQPGQLCNVSHFAGGPLTLPKPLSQDRQE